MNSDDGNRKAGCSIDGRPAAVGWVLGSKRRKAPTPRRGVIREAVPFGRVHIGLCGPLKPVLDRSIFMVMFVDSAS